MLPDGFLDSLPGNLSRQAVRDLLSILRRSAREFGIHTARRSRDRLLTCCRAIETGQAHGHTRLDVMPATPTLFITEPPWIIAYSPQTRQVTRILHGARDFPALFR